MMDGMCTDLIFALGSSERNRYMVERKITVSLFRESDKMDTFEFWNIGCKYDLVTECSKTMYDEYRTFVRIFAVLSEYFILDMKIRQGYEI